MGSRKIKPTAHELVAILRMVNLRKWMLSAMMATGYDVLGQT
jgi:hypothetical protein